MRVLLAITCMLAASAGFAVAHEASEVRGRGWQRPARPQGQQAPVHRHRCRQKCRLLSGRQAAGRPTLPPAPCMSSHSAWYAALLHLQCEGALGGLRRKLEKVQQQLAAAEASGSSCTKEAGALKERLAAAAGAASSQQAKLQVGAGQARLGLGAFCSVLAGWPALAEAPLPCPRPAR